MSVKLREKLMKDRSSSLYLDIYYQGKRKYEFLNIHLSNRRKFGEGDKEKREIAEKLRIKRENELLNQEKVTFSNKNNDNFYNYYEKFINQKQTRHTHWKPLKVHIQDFSGNVEFLSFKDITEDWLLDFQQHLLIKLSNNTVLKYLILTSSVLDDAKIEGIIGVNPYKTIDKDKKLSQNKESDRIYLTLEELEKIFSLEVSTSELKYKQIFLFSCFTGLRWSDVHRLRWEDIKSIKNDKKTRRVIAFKQQKTGQQEYMPLCEQAISLLNDIQDKKTKSGFVFSEIVEETNKEHKVSVLNRVNRVLKQWAEKAEIKKSIHFHVSRHTFATMSLTHGIDIYMVSKLLGHKSIEMTTVYAKVIDKKKNEAVAKMPKLTIE